MTTNLFRNFRDEFRVMRGLSMRWFRETTVSPFGLAIMLAIKPVLWYVLFGSLFQQISALPAFPAENYKAFILPGVAALMAIEYIVLGGQCIVDDISSGFIGKLWAAPVSRVSVVGARIIVMTTLNVAQTTLLLALAYFDGVRLATGVLGAVTIVFLSALITIITTAISLFIAYALKYEFAFSVVTSFLVLPVLFVSNAFSPPSFMPKWLATIANVNPVSIAITGMRALALEGWVWADITPAVILLTTMAVISVSLTGVVFTRTLENEQNIVEWLVMKLGTTRVSITSG
ncbi:MAG: ABC transporter permease [Halobacteriaceae archaeon]